MELYQRFEQWKADGKPYADYDRVEDKKVQ
jgi:hypothetical protein